MTVEQRAAEVAKKASDQHGRVREALVVLAVVIERCANGAERPGRTEVASALATVRDQLERHFVAEETMRLHEHLGILLPSAATELRALVREHGLLRSLIRRCCMLAEAYGMETIPELRAEVELFLRRLHQHEEAEDRLMRQALPSTQTP